MRLERREANGDDQMSTVFLRLNIFHSAACTVFALAEYQIMHQILNLSFPHEAKQFDTRQLLQVARLVGVQCCWQLVERCG